MQILLKMFNKIQSKKTMIVKVEESIAEKLSSNVIVLDIDNEFHIIDNSN